MRIIFHIGMGKTGTSSIQTALRTNTANLAEQNAAYLGMRFTAISPLFQGSEGDTKFFAAPPEQMAEHAGKFLEHLSARAQKDGTKTFILSNESIFGNAPRITPFIETLRKQISVSLIVYLRDPNSWLPSAYTQWGIRHKFNKGPIQPFGTRARKLIDQYEGVRFWVKKFPEILTVRSYEKGKDVVLDFAEATDITLTPDAKRSLERAEPAETLLRALFNNRFPNPVLPNRFDKFVINPTGGPAPSVREMAGLCFNYEDSEQIIAEKRELFEFIRDTLGLDYLANTPEPSKQLDETELQHRLIDYLTEITLNQAQRLQRLEQMVNELKDR